MFLRLTSAVGLAAALLVFLPAAVGATSGAPAAISFDPEPLGSWAAVGNTLTADPGIWSGSPTSVTAQWYRCDASARNCTAIAGGDSLAWTLVSADLGKTLFAQVTATNANGSRSESTYATGVVGAPTVTAQPEISGDVNDDGSTLSVSTGAWTGSPTSYGYQWFSCDPSPLSCTAISGATSSTFQVDDSALLGDFVLAEVTASDASGSALNAAEPSFAVGVAHTDQVGAYVSMPQPLVYPSWTGDASKTGNVLVGDRGVWSSQPSTFNYQWVDCADASLNGCTQILGATSPTYTVQASDAGHVIGLEVGAGNLGGCCVGATGGGSLVDNTYASDAGPAWAPEPTVPPQLSGDATGVGSVLHVDSSWAAPQDSNITLSYQWVRCDANLSNCAAIAGANAADYTLTGSELGATVYAVVSATNSYGTTAADSTTITPPIGAPVNGDPPEISGVTSAPGGGLDVSTGTWSNSPTSYAYQWWSCDANGLDCEPISGATSSSYETVAGDAGSTLIAEVDATNGYGTTTAFSDLTGVIASGGGGGGGGGSGGGGGGGGGGGSIPNLRVAWSASTLDPAPGTEDDFTITVTNSGGAGSLQTHLRITLPGTVTLLGAPYYERGSGCTGTQQIDCFLDYIPNGASTVVKLSTKVSGSGLQDLVATASADRDADLSDNTATETIQVGAPAPAPAAPPVPAPAPALASPTLRQVKARTLTGVVKATSEVVDGSFTANEPLKLTLSVTPASSAHRLRLLKGTRFAGGALRAGATTVTRSIAHGGVLAFHAVLAKSALTHGKRYVIHIAAKNARGKTTSLTIPFRA